MEPLDKEHFGDDINLGDLFFVERFSSLGGSKCIVRIILGRSVSHVLCREVYYTVSSFGRDSYGRFHYLKFLPCVCAYASLTVQESLGMLDLVCMKSTLRSYTNRTIQHVQYIHSTKQNKYKEISRWY